MRAEGGGEERGGREGLSAHSQCAVSPHFSLFPSPHFHPHLRNSAWMDTESLFSSSLFPSFLVSPPLSSSWLTLPVLHPFLPNTQSSLSLSLLLIFPRRPALCQHGEQITAKLLNMGSCFYKGHQGQSLPDCI